MLTNLRKNLHFSFPSIDFTKVMNGINGKNLTSKMLKRDSFP